MIRAVSYKPLIRNADVLFYTYIIPHFCAAVYDKTVKNARSFTAVNSRFNDKR